MENKKITYRKMVLDIKYQPTNDKTLKVEKRIKVEAPQFTECTHDVGFAVLKELGSTAYAIYMAILSYRNSTTNDCHPSINKIHEDFGFAIRTIKDNLNKLYNSGYLNINSGHKNIASNYYFPKEYWYQAWEEDYNQSNAGRRKNVIKEKRRTKQDMQKEINQLQATIDRLKRENNKINIEIGESEVYSNSKDDFDDDEF